MPAAGKAVNPRLFSPGACVAYPPVRGNRHLTVFLDAGHGGVDPGAVGATSSGATILEEQETLPIELDAASLLRQSGFRVVVSRTTNSTVARIGPGDVVDGSLTEAFALHDVAARDVCANEAKANALIGIYMDAGYSSSNAGCLTAYDAIRPFARSSLKLATLVERDVVDALNAHRWGIPNLGVSSDANLGSAVGGDTAAANYGHLLLLGPAQRGYFSTPSDMPGALIEPLFITDPFEGSIAASSNGQHTIAGGIAAAVTQYFAGTGSVARSN